MLFDVVGLRVMKVYNIRKYSYVKDNGVEPFQNSSTSNWEHFPSRNDIVLTIQNTTQPPVNPTDYIFKIIWKSSVLV